MVVTRTCQLENLAATLFQLADLVEQAGLSAGDVGAVLLQTQNCEQNNVEMHRDLRRLRASGASPADFARGLRREAAALNRQAADDSVSP